jgi:hypothetical protein
MEEYSVKITPVFAEPEKMGRYFSDNGFDDDMKIVISDHSFEVIFKKESRAKALKDFLNGQIISGNLIDADGPIPVNNSELAPPPPQRSSPYRRMDDIDRDYDIDRDFRDRDRDYRSPPSYSSRGYSRRESEPRRVSSYGRDEIPRRKEYFTPREEIHSRTLLIRGYPVNVPKRNVWDDFKSFGYLKQIEIKDSLVYVQYETEDDADNAVSKAPRNILSIEQIPDRPLNIPRFVVPLVVEEDRDSKH